MYFVLQSKHNAVWFYSKCYDTFIIQVAYHGTPLKAYEVFTTALKVQYLEKGLVLPLVEEQNPAGKLFSLLFYIGQH